MIIDTPQNQHLANANWLLFFNCLCKLILATKKKRPKHYHNLDLTPIHFDWDMASKLQNKQKMLVPDETEKSTILPPCKKQQQWRTLCENGQLSIMFCETKTLFVYLDFLQNFSKLVYSIILSFSKLVSRKLKSFGKF